jgi:predicted porin
MKRLLICALALGGFAASAHAADLSVDSLKDPLPEKISYAGVTVYGTLDVGYAYQEHGYQFSQSMYTGLQYAPRSFGPLGSISTLTNNAMSQSFVGVKVEEGLGNGFVALGKIESGFDPVGGELADACKSLKMAASNPNVYSGDGGRCGQFLNGQAYAGVSNKTYGTLTVGRQNSLMNDGVGTYDPNHGSYAFSMIGLSGTVAAGTGATETSRWDNSIKYAYELGPVHAAVLYSSGGDSTSIQGDAIGGNAGFTYKGLSVDGYYTKENGAVTLGSYAPATDNFSFRLLNNEAYSVMAKYTMDLGGGFKDAPASKLTFFGGYVHIDSDTLSAAAMGAYSGSSTLNGYKLGTPQGAFTGRVIQTAWAGATYETGAWAFTGAYYRENQNAYANTATNGGNEDFVSGVVDYKFNKHFDVYSGVTWTDFTGGWSHNAAGVANSVNENVSVVSGVRLKF